jgi:CRP/FNR family transcriptional regulator, cyclic AMP receptor protein
VQPPKDPPITADTLRDIGLFGALPDETLTYLCQSLPTLPFPPGEVIFREGDAGRDMFVVLAGELEVMKHSRTGHDARVAMLGIHDWFGEMSLLDVQPRSATVRVIAPCTLLRISSADLDALYRHDLKSYTLIVLNVARELSRRLRVADGLLADIILQFTETYIARRPGQPAS